MSSLMGPCARCGTVVMIQYGLCGPCRYLLRDNVHTTRR